MPGIKADGLLVTDAEAGDLLDWLDRRWRGWRLPVLFLEVKALIGCRITELAAARPADLKVGRITFIAQTNKGRKERVAILPAPVFGELKALAGREYVFEAFSEQLRTIYLDRGCPHHSKRVSGYRPERLKDWLENEAQLYFKKSGSSCLPYRLMEQAWEESGEIAGA